MNDFKVSTNHQAIEDWATRHNAAPAIIEAQNVEDQGLRFDFPGSDDERELTIARPTQRATWEEFFNIFDKNELALVTYSHSSGDPSLSYRFIKADQASKLNEASIDQNWDDPDAIQTLPSSQDRD